MASTAGYALSKIPAYSIVSTMSRDKRKRWLIILILAMLMLCNGFYAVLPDFAKASFCSLLVIVLDQALTLSVAYRHLSRQLACLLGLW